MSSTRWTLLATAWFLSFSSAHGEEVKAPDPLFQSDEILTVRIVAPIATIVSERSDETELPGTLHYTNAAGEAVDLDIQLRARGNFRRNNNICRFPPMRLNIKTKQAKGTLFQKQDKLKLVTHCQNSSKFEQIILREYTAYRILNVMTDDSFKVRLLKITYVDSEGKREDDERYGFVIEHKDRLAKRIGEPVLEIPNTHPRNLQADIANMVDVYHFLIGNTDFSSVKGAPDEACCHNHVLFGDEGEKIVSVPYDFDQSGLVDAPYAGANPKFKLRTVRERLYRGRCMHNDYIPASIAMFNEKKEAIYAVLSELEIASPSSIKSMNVFVDKFYKIVNSERRVNNDLIKKCI